MFNISLFELIIFLIIAILFVGPKDLPEIARFIGKTIYHIKKFYQNSRDFFNKLASEVGINDLKQEVAVAIKEEKQDLEGDITIIVDMDGNEHRVKNIQNIRNDLNKDELKSEIDKQNLANSK